MNKTTLCLFLFLNSVLMAHHEQQPAITHHESENAVISMLTAKIDARPTANLLTLRAQLYREDGLFDKAKADVKSALKLDPSFAPALSLQEKLPVENR